jgi:TPR repeat protein
MHRGDSGDHVGARHAGEKRFCKKTVLPSFSAILLVALSSTVFSDYQTGLDAYSNGNFRLAMQEWIEVTEQPPASVNPAIFAEAHYAVARLYWDGQGVTRDYFVAHDWLTKAADLGHSGAMAKLGYLYTDGIAVQQDFEQAFDWYSKAAKLGDVDGLYNLGVFYLNGWGTPPDRTMAKQYLAAASAKGDAAAEQALQQLLQEDESVREASAATAHDQENREQGSLLQAYEINPELWGKPVPTTNPPDEAGNLVGARQAGESESPVGSAATEDSQTT